IAENATNDLIEYYLKPCIANTIIEDRDAFPSVSQEFNAHAPAIIEELFKSYVQSNVVHVHPTTTSSTETDSSADLQYQMYLKLKRSLQDRANDIALWEALNGCFEKSLEKIRHGKLESFDSFQKVFSSFGPVLKIAMFDKNGDVKALIQYPGERKGQVLYTTGSALLCRIHSFFILVIQGLFSYSYFESLSQMLFDDIGDVTITNDGATILKMLDVEHPAAKVLVELVELQDREVGDGTTSVVIIAAELLKRANDLVRNKIHPTSVIEGS
ncbi:T-complex protein 1 subunit alpha-like protein, partial [Tanacetum coccineum]